MSWLNAGNERRNMSSPIPWLYLTLFNQPLDMELCHHLQRIHSIPLSPRVQFHCHRMENKYQLQSCMTQEPLKTPIVEGTLPLSKESATETTMFIQGVGLTPVSVPLHTVFLRCGLVTRPVVGARPTLPVQGISLLLGNNLAGSRVIPGTGLMVPERYT